MKILITGATGFIGRNLCERIETLEGDFEIFKINSKSSDEELFSSLKQCDILFNLAAVHRPKNLEDFNSINVLYLKRMLDFMQENNIKCKVVEISSIHANNETLYGISKLIAERIVEEYSNKTQNISHVLRLTNTFGKYAKPNAHSVVATFCYNISHDIPIQINDPIAAINLCYIDDVIDLLISYLYSTNSTFEYLRPNKVFPITIGSLAEILSSFRNGQEVNNQNDYFVEKLRETYNWYSSCK